MFCRWCLTDHLTTESCNHRFYCPACNEDETYPERGKYRCERCHHQFTPEEG
jgi:uncharacterized Zn ribbon protein